VDRWRTIDTESNSVDHFRVLWSEVPNSLHLDLRYCEVRSPDKSKVALKSQPCEGVENSEDRVLGIAGTSCLTPRPPKL
jgi:hypothetical protein